MCLRAAVLILGLSLSAAAQQLTGKWEGVISEPARPVVFRVEFHAQDRLGDLEVLGQKLKVEVIASDPQHVEFRTQTSQAWVFTGTLESGRVQGTFEQAGGRLPFVMEREPDLPPPANRVEAWQQDLDYAQRKVMRLDRSFSPQDRERFAEAIRRLRAGAASSDDPHLIVGLARAVAMAQSGHTRLYLLRNRTELRRFPLRIWWFKDGV